MFRAEKSMFRPPGNISQAARFLGKNNVWSVVPLLSCSTVPAIHKLCHCSTVPVYLHTCTLFKLAHTFAHLDIYTLAHPCTFAHFLHLHTLLHTWTFNTCSHFLLIFACNIANLHTFDTCAQFCTLLHSFGRVVVNNEWLLTRLGAGFFKSWYMY